MKILQKLWTKTDGWTGAQNQSGEGNADIVFLFGATGTITDQKVLQELRENYPRSIIFGCSTAGEIHGNAVYDGSASMTAIRFDSTRVHHAGLKIQSPADSREAGRRLMSMLPQEDLVHVLILSEGVNINGSALTLGLSESLPEHIKATGGLSGDGEGWQKTLVFSPNGNPENNQISAVGFYGKKLRVGYGSLGGWDPFGPERKITKSSGNILYEMDGKSALELYKKYLGEHASGLPAAGLLFPLRLRTPDSQDGVVRTILSVDEKEHSITFAGDMPEGSYARLMKANFDRLIDGASGAAQSSSATFPRSPDLALLISCVGRKLILRQRNDEEVEAVREVLGKNTTLAGFYSNGEISPLSPGANCELHNQTMTITTFSED